MTEKVISLEKEKRGSLRTYETIEFAVIHLIPLLALITGATAFDWLMCGVLYFARMFFVTGFYHRYYSHKTFKTSRVFQFIMSFFA